MNAELAGKFAIEQSLRQGVISAMVRWAKNSRRGIAGKGEADLDLREAQAQAMALAEFLSG